MPERRYYFQIPSANVIGSVMALSLADAKAKVLESYSHEWPELEWINIETITESIIYG
jgi:hypothetical protein